MTKSRGILKPRRKWTEHESALFFVLYPCTYSATLAKLFNCSLYHVYKQANKLKVKKSKWYMDSPMAQHLKADSSIGIAYRFKPGQIPPNKGKKCGSHPNSIPTQFKPGQKSANYRPVGSLRIDTDGYVLIKMAEGKFQWRFLQRILWERMHGKIPHGHVVSFVDGNKLNCNITNLTLMTKKQNVLRNSPHNYGPEIADIYRLKARITRQINKTESANHV